MKLKEKINTDYLIAFKSKNAVSKSILSVVKGEIQTTEKNINVVDLSDDEVVKILNKISKSLKETISQSDDSKSKEELVIIESYLPKQMSESEISEKVDVLFSDGYRSIGDFMKAFAGIQADRKIVSKIVTERLKKQS